MKTLQTSRALAAIALAAAGALCTLPTMAQVAAKTAVPEAVPVVPAFTQWVNTVVVVPEPAPVAAVTNLPVTYVAGAATAPYEPWPVIVGNPELPLIGVGSTQASRVWGTTFNYQGMHVKLLALDASGRRIESRPVSALPRPGERFKLRVAATFDAVADISLIVGEPFAGQRAGQFYPAPGMSAQLLAGETVDLPLEANQYFVMGPNTAERLVLSVRHAKALGDARSLQPAYRQDGRAGSSYLQLVPQGTHPAIEQLVSVANY